MWLKKVMGCGASSRVVESDDRERHKSPHSAAECSPKLGAAEVSPNAKLKEVPSVSTSVIEGLKGHQGTFVMSKFSNDSMTTSASYLNQPNTNEALPPIQTAEASFAPSDAADSTRGNGRSPFASNFTDSNVATSFLRIPHLNSEVDSDARFSSNAFGSRCRSGSVVSTGVCNVPILPTFSHCNSRDSRFQSPCGVNRCDSYSPTARPHECSRRCGWGEYETLRRLSINNSMDGTNGTIADTATTASSVEHSNNYAGHRYSFIGTDCGCSSLFYDPCERCSRCILDTEAVYRCDLCMLIFCTDCHAEIGAALHRHKLTSFRRAVNSNVTDSFLINKGRNRDGNKVINEYVVIKVLGRGSHAKVNLVQHHQDRTFYAVKILRCDRTKKIHHGIVSKSSTASDDDLLREIAVMKFVSHPNLIKLKEVIDDVESHKVYVIMEYCAKGPVHVHGEPPLPPEKVRKYGCDILSGLLQLHAQYLYHWDIKPANCLVDDNDVAKIADFGACGSSTRTCKVGGTPAYSCPEQFAGTHIGGHVADSWAFAMTLYQMSHGTLAYSTTSISSLRDSMLDPTPLPIQEGVEPELKDLLRRMLNKDMSQRMMLHDAMKHSYFSGYVTQSYTTVEPSNESAGCITEDLYARAQQAVLRGKRVGDFFHGVQFVRRIRRMMVRHINTHDVDDDDFFPELREASSLESTQRLVTNEADIHEVHKIVSSFVGDAVKGALRIDGILMTTLHSFVAEAAPLVSKLCCSNNKLTCVGTVDFSKFQHLRVLQICENSLRQFPLDVLHAPRLQFLDLSHNHIKDIPPALTCARELQTLCMNHNQVAYVGCNECGASVLSGESMQKVVLTANPLRHLPAEITSCSKLELILDDAPSLLEEWYASINQSTSVSITWNDIYPCRVYPEVPLFVASKSIKLYNLTILEALGTRNVVLTQFESWLPTGEVNSAAMEEHVRRRQKESVRVNGNDSECEIRSPVVRKTAMNVGDCLPIPNILSKSVCRFLHSYFILEEKTSYTVSAYGALKNYLTTCLGRNESVVVFLDERRDSQNTRDTIVAVLCEVLMAAKGGKRTLSGCISDVVDATRGLYA